MIKNILAIYGQYKIIIFPVFVGIASLALISFIIVPQFEEYQKGQEEINQVQNRLDTLGKKAQDLKDINSQDLDIKLAAAVNAFPPDRDFPGVVGLIQKVASDKALAVTTLQIGQTSSNPTQGIPSFLVRFEVTGKKASVDSMLNALESSARIVKISALDISSRQSDDVVADISIDAFYGPSPSALGSIDAPVAKVSPEEEKILANLAVVPVVTTSDQNLSLVPRGRADPFQ